MSNNLYVKHIHAKTKKELNKEEVIYKRVWWNDMIYTMIEVDKDLDHVWIPFDISNYKVKKYIDSSLKSFEDKMPSKPLDLDYDL